MSENTPELESRLREHGETLGEDVSRTAQHARNAAAEMASKAKDTLRDYGQQGYQYATEHGRELKERSESYIHQNPWYAIGIALGVGLLVGMLVRSGSRD